MTGEFRFPVAVRVSYLFQNVQNGLGARPASWSVDTGTFFPGVKVPQQASDHLLPLSTEVKNDWNPTPLPPPNTFMA